ncbi:MAG: elongation factor G [SAR202 cluster bacterium Casp-Chloro-G3]|nr:elongation factor G [Chloroflexota bacterium]PKB57950.1 MAG: elongation factor G [SAR202 cluster bacterium Casp-Chloro-G3]
MPKIDVTNLRNVALLSHSGAGKTALSEALLFNAQVINRLGSVEDGNTVSDYEPEEIKRRSSVQTTLIACSGDRYKVNFLDTPGYDDFIGEVVAALRAVEGAAILVPGPSGVDVGTERSWELCEDGELPRMFLVNKMDRENANFSRTVADIQGTFGNKCVPFQLPIGEAQDFKGVVSIVRPPSDIPAEVADQFESARERLIEAVAESDDELAERYLEGEELTDAEIIAGARKAICSGDLVPILASSATQNIGVNEFLEMVQEFLPSPLDVKKPTMKNASGNATEFEVDPAGPLAAFVFKTTADPFVGKLSLFRVFRGTISSNSEIWNSARKQSERIGQLYLPRGKSQENITEVVAGDIGAIGKLALTVTGDTLCARDNPVAFEKVNFPAGFYSVAVSPATKADLDKMSTSLSRIVEEDPSLSLSRQVETSEMVLTGFGEAQIDVAIDKIKRKFGAELETRLPRVPYRESISRVTKAEYRHKKQSGGHGQYGHVVLRLEPKERDQGFEFGSEIVGGKVPKEYIPAVEKGIVKTLEEGVVAGFPVVDLKAIIYDGSFHDVDSSGMSFEIASSQALRKGLLEANPILLEPIVKLKVNVPDAYTGEVMSDLNVKRGRILEMTPNDRYTVIEAEVPHSEVQRYSQDLRSLTQGRGSYEFKFDHYEPVPQNIEQKVIQDVKRAKEQQVA